METAMLNIQLTDKVKISKIKNKCSGNINIFHHVKRLKWGWAEYIGRLKNFRPGRGSNPR